MEKNKEKIKQKIDIKKNLSIRTIIIIAIIVLILSIIYISNFMMTKAPNLYYRVYTKKDGWTSWTRGGVELGNKKDDILNIQVKINKKYNSNQIITSNILIDDGWTGNYTHEDKLDNQKIYAIKLSGSKNIVNKYEICYRTYNSKDKWLEWTCGPDISGNKDETIKALQIKLIPKGAVKYDYLDDYNKKITPNVGF